MRVSAVATAAMAGLVSAQNYHDIPACAMPCMQTAVSNTVCSFTDIACLCSKDNFAAIKAAAASCVIENCGPSKAAGEVLPAVQKLCSAIGDAIENRPFGPGSSPSGSGAAAPAVTDEASPGEATPDLSGHHHLPPPAYSAPPSYSSAEGSLATPTGISYGPEPPCEGEDVHGDAVDMPGETGMPMPKNGTGEHPGAPKPSSPVTAGAAGLAPMGVLAVMIAGALAL
ncbi:hypothetical protein E4U59_001772 [Claviceps monticola]|nr:hypothetical protein E4U59_001772 [Claviceps monticola]